MAVSGLFAARHRSRLDPARLPLVCLYLVVGVTGVTLGDWPVKLAALALAAAALCRVALTGWGAEERTIRGSAATGGHGGRP
ncbi:hypothetical protein [Streptomyces sp. NPDC088847]|uniref:hypothetical protein n=1 Tax=Streptomyces sp. NPDC088847 TaxID=3365909 RepID=UPI0038212FA7